jgi:cytochrome c-type protein NapB
MSEQKTKKVSLPIVILCVMLMSTFLFVQIRVFDLFGGDSFENIDDKKSSSETWVFEDIRAAKGMYENLKDDFVTPNFIDSSAKQRSLEEFYSLRAYSGAPPVIPHRIGTSRTLTGDSCLGCHEFGGYTPKFDAYAPVVPHPEKINCRQCHNPRNEEGGFKQTEWVKNSGERGFAHLAGSPLVIPHRLQMRENCLSCHAGPAAVSEIRTSHPERVNCLQCHVVQDTKKAWVRQ